MPNILRDLVIDEVSFCRKGMNPGAKVALFKSAPLGKMDDMLFADILQSREDVDAKYEAAERFEFMSDVMSSSMFRISFDDELDKADKEKLMKESVKQFSDAVKDIIAPLAKAKDAMSVEKISLESKTMPKDINQVMKEMDVNEATAKVIVKMEEQTAEAKKTAEDAGKNLAKAREELETMRADIKKKEEEAAEKKEEEAAEKDDILAKAKKEGVSEEIMKAMREQAEDIRKMKEENAQREFEAKAVPFAKAGLGTKEDLGTQLRKAHDTDPELAKTLMDSLSKAAKLVNESDLLKQVGKEGGANDDGSSKAVLAKVGAAVAELRKADVSLSEAEAEIAYFKQNPKLYDEYLVAKRNEAR